MTSQDTGGTGFPGARAAARSAGRVQSPRWLPASPGRNAPGWGATGGGSCVLHVGRAFVQYAQPLASRSSPSWSRPTRGRSPGRSRRCVGATGSRDRGQVGQKGPEVPGPTTKTPRSRSRQQPSVHSADINGPDVDAHSRDRWNSAVVLRDSTPVSSVHHRLQGNRPTPDSRPSERLRSEETRQARQAACVLSPPRADGR